MDQEARLKAATATLFNKKDIAVTTAVSVAYLLLAQLIVGFKADQLVLVLLFNAMYYFSFATRRFITGFSIFIVYWIVFDFMKVLPNYTVNAVHIADLYQAEKKLFGIDTGNATLTANEYFALHQGTAFDWLSGIFYLCWVPVPLLFAGWLFFNDARALICFALTFFFVNLLGFVVYYIYPAAPPWYVQLHGFQFIAGTPGNTAGLSRFDALVGAKVFASLYAKSSNVFAAMPSLHSAYPVIVLYYGLKHRLGWINLLFATIMAGIWFAAVYTSHHYILDVLAGILCAVTGNVLFDGLIAKQRRFKMFLHAFVARVQAESRVLEPGLPGIPTTKPARHPRPAKKTT